MYIYLENNTFKLKNELKNEIKRVNAELMRS